MNKHHFKYLFYVLLCSEAFSLPSLSGTIYNQKDSTLLSNTQVELRNKFNSLGTIASKNGKFLFLDIEPGEYNLVVSYIGYETYKKLVRIKEKDLTIDFLLKVEPILMASLEIISDSQNPYKKLPGAATVINKETLKLINPVGTQEMLEFIPGIIGYADDGVGNSRISIGIRGLNPRRSSRVLILEDGVPIQPALYIYPNMYYNPPAERIDQIEVIKGSGAINFGPQTMGGVINYFTRRPRNDFGGILKLSGGENGFASMFAEVGGWGSKKLKPELQLLLKRGDGFRQNNSFEQVNATLKINYLHSKNKNIYLKSNVNYENTNATYTGLTAYSYENNPKFNPKENDNFKVFRAAFDLIKSERLTSVTTKKTTAYTSYFDRRWWRENDIFILASDLGEDNPVAQPYYTPFNNIIRVGNGEDSFGILRTFYVVGYEQSYNIKHMIFGYDASMEVGARLYWERFIDDKKAGSEVDSREGIYYIPSDIEGETPTIVGQSHHYETMAFSAFLSETVRLGSFELRPGLRVEAFEQERVDRLAGSLYLDKSTVVLLPGLGFITEINPFSIFGGIHRGFTPPSSGALKILNFGEESSGNGLDLKSEKSWNKEIGVRSSISFINFELSVFHVSIENLVAAGRGTAFKNLGKVNSQGIEFKSTFSLNKVNSILPIINISYTFLDTEVMKGRIISNVTGSIGSEVDISGKELPYAPSHSLIVGLQSNIVEKLLVRIDHKYVSEVYTDFENILKTDNLGITGPVPGYSVLNLSASFQANNRYRIYFSGKNITDENYIGSRLHSNPGQKEAGLSSGIIIGPRRQLNLGLEYSF